MHYIDLLILLLLVVIVFVLIRQKKTSDKIKQILYDSCSNDKMQHENFNTALHLVKRQVDHLSKEINIIATESARMDEDIEKISSNISNLLNTVKFNKTE
jgi:phage terminase Nu1 subunit (DNA packaging protein)